MEKRYIVEGMMCSACQASVERVINRIEGVNNANVNLISKLLIIDEQYDIPDEIIFNAIKKAGFTPLKYKESNKSNKKTTQSKDNKIVFRLISSVVILLPIIYVSMAEMFNLPIIDYFNIDLNPSNNILIQALLSLIIMIINYKYFVNGFKGIIHLSPNMDTLISLGSLISYLYSLSNLINVYKDKPINNLYFDSSAMIITFILIGKTIESKARNKSYDSINALKELVPKEVNIFDSGNIIKKNIEDVKIGEIVSLKAGEIVPFDSLIIEGSAYIDESSITGESLLVSKTINDQLKSGTINKDGYLLLKVIKESKDSTLNNIIDAANKAGTSKSNMQRLADKVSGVFVPTIICLSILTFLIWYLCTKDIDLSIKYSIEVLVVSCPCALGLATPVAVTCSISSLSKKGILIKEANVFEKINSTNIIIFDKTGTLTKGNIIVDKINYYNIKKEEALVILKSLESKSNHPISKAITSYLDNDIKNVYDYEEKPGFGIKGSIDNSLYMVGNKRYLNEFGLNTESKANVFLFSNKEILAEIYLKDEIKNESKELVDTLHKLSYKIYMITGDNYDEALNVKDVLSLDAFYNNKNPIEKANIIKEVQNLGFNTIYVGDGINDTVALKEASVSISFKEGLDIAKESSDIVFLKDNIKNIPLLIKKSNKAVKIIKENLFWAFFYNALSIPLAAGAFSALGISLTPAICSIMMSLSSIIVVLNALRLRR